MVCILCILQKRSAQMKAIRASTNKRPHSGGDRPFAARAEEYTKKGEHLGDVYILLTSPR